MRPFPDIPKLSVVALRNTDQTIALNEYLRLVVYMFTPGQHLTELWQAKGKFWGKQTFLTLQDNSDAAREDIAIRPLPSCLLDN